MRCARYKGALQAVECYWRGGDTEISAVRSAATRQAEVPGRSRAGQAEPTRRILIPLDSIAPLQPGTDGRRPIDGGFNLGGLNR